MVESNRGLESLLAVISNGMKTIFEHIEHVKGKPHHIRKRVAFGAAGACTAVVALIWLVGSLGTGAFALKDTSFAQSTSGVTNVTDSGANDEQLAGVGAASVVGKKSAPARIEIIDASPSTSSVKKIEQTTIPF